MLKKPKHREAKHRKMSPKRILKNQNFNWKKIISAAALVAFAVVGAYMLKFGFAASPSSPTATASCGARVNPYNYQVPYGKAVWNQPVCGLPRYARSAEFAERFYKWSNLNDGTPAEQQRVAGRLGSDFGIPQPTLLDPDGLASSFSRTVYDAADATTTTKIHAFSYESNLDGTAWNDQPLFARPGYISKNPDTQIPWNPNWKTGEGGDNEIVILDKQSGRIYEVSGYKRGLAAVSQCGVFATPDRICTYTVNIGRDLSGNVIDYRTFEGYHDGRGVGLSQYATFTMAEEVKAGEIRHALGVAIPNTAFGPICTPAQLGTAAESNTCATALAPATKVEWGGPQHTSIAFPFNDTIRALYSTNTKAIPEGTRFALDIDDTYINNWLNSRADLAGAANARKRETFRIFAVALRDYGFIVADTGGNGPGVQIEGSANPKTRQLWSDLGIKTIDDQNVFQGLITATNLYVVEPPTNKCQDGSSSKYFCKWTSSSYGTVTAPTDSANPSVTITTPSNNAQINGIVAVSVNATDDIGVTKVEFYVDNALKQTSTTAPYSYSLNAGSLSAGSHTILVKAYDASGKSGQATVTVTVGSTTPQYVTDFSGDGKTTAIDLATLLNYFNSSVQPFKLGDCDGNGKVEILDLSILLTRYTK